MGMRFKSLFNYQVWSSGPRFSGVPFIMTDNALMFIKVLKQVKQYCGSDDVPVAFSQVGTLQKAKEVPCEFNNWGVFYEGNFETVNLLLDVNNLKRKLQK